MFICFFSVKLYTDQLPIVGVILSLLSAIDLETLGDLSGMNIIVFYLIFLVPVTTTKHWYNAMTLSQ